MTRVHRLRIVQVVTQLEGGGAQGAALQVAEGLRRREHDTQTWFLYRKGPAYDDASHVQTLLDRPPLGVFDYLRICARLVRGLRRVRPDAVVTYTHYANVLGQTAAMVARVPSRVASQRNPSWRYPRIVRWCDGIAGTLGVYTANVMVSESVRSTFRGYPRGYRGRSLVVPNAVAFQRPEFARREARLRFGLAGGSPLVVTVGRLSSQKNHEVLVKALALLPGVRLAVAGGGSLREELQAMAESLGVAERLHLLGELSHSDIPSLFRAGDLFVLPSRFEGMSNALLEAMAAGLPVIASDTPAQREVLANGESRNPAGLLVGPDDVEGWAGAIRRVLGDDEFRSELAARAVERSKDFPLDRMVDGFEKAVLASSGRRSAGSMPADGDVQAYPVLGTTVHALTIGHLHALIKEAVESRTQVVIASQNLHGVYLARSDPKMRRLHERAYLRIDGMPLVWAGRLKGYRLRAEHRVTWMDWIHPFIAECTAHGWRVFYLGSEREVAERGAEVLRERFEGLDLTVAHGFFDPAPDAAENRAVLERIANCRPDVLLVGMGMPRQEHWILDNLEALDIPAVLTSGAAMEYVAGAVPTPPRWIGRIGLEWLYRLTRDPRRFWERYLIEPWMLAGGLIRDRIRSRRPPGP